MSEIKMKFENCNELTQLPYYEINEWGKPKLAIDLPPIVKIDFAGSRIASEDGQRSSPIKSAEALSDVLVLHGHQEQRGWTMVINRATGQLSASVSDLHGAFVIAGACTALDRPFTSRLEERIDEEGQSRHVEWLRNVSRDEKLAFLRGLSVLSVPATFG